MTQVSLNPSDLQPRPHDRELFDRLLRTFVPNDPFDFHAHLYRAHDLPDQVAAVSNDWTASLSCYRRQMAEWMGERAPRDGLFFPLPDREVDVAGANEFCLTEAARAPQSRALLLIRPTDDPAVIDSLVAQRNPLVAGFKVYHVFADRTDTLNASIDQFLPEWAWEMADQRGLLIMLHMVRPLAIADPDNQQSIRRLCLRYPNARLVLAHAARGFCARHTVDGLEALRGLDNVWFDTSVICEPAPFLAILQALGPRKLLFGSDYPVCNMQGRCSSVGDGFFWFYKDNVEWADSDLGGPTLIGIESLLALRQACQLAHLSDKDVESIFRDNARAVLSLDDQGDQRGGDQRGQELYAKARQIIPGGTQLLSKRPEMFAPGRWPPYFVEARGVQVVDVDGREFVDMSTMSVGACLLGYADPEVNAAVSRRVTLGSMSSLNSADELELAEVLLALHPWAEMVRYTRAGGEALAAAVRIARASTGRSKIAFCGYHGWQDWYLAANLSNETSDDPLAGHLLSGLDATGVPCELAGTALPFQFNCPDELDAIVAGHGDDLAAIVMEPTRHQSPDPGFLEGVRQHADRTGAVLIFDEVSAGWRLCLGGAHLNFNVRPDMAVFSKALANGYPMAAILGVASVMQAAQQSFISSTMWTDGIGPAAALATVRKFQQHDVPAHVATIGARFRQSVRDAANRRGIEIGFQGVPALSILSFAHPDAQALQTLLTVRMLERGYLLGSGFYPSFAHRPHHVDACVAAVDEVFSEIREAVQAGDATARLPGPVRHSGFQRLA